MKEHRFESLTKEQLAEMDGIPEVYKKAIEHAIWESTSPEDPIDKVWPDYFRAAEVNSLLECKISDDDVVEMVEYQMNCIDFSAGWKAAYKRIIEFLTHRKE